MPCRLRRRRSRELDLGRISPNRLRRLASRSRLILLPVPPAAASYINGKERAYLITPVPEPETWALLLVGLGLIRLFVRGSKCCPTSP